MPDRRAYIDECLSRIAAGDARAFTELFTTYHPRLCTYAERVVGSPEAAKEIVSDVFLWVWEHRTEWRVSGSVASYLYGAVRNRAFNLLKREGRAKRAHEAALLLGYSPGMSEAPASPEEELHARELACLVERAVNQLPARAREAFTLQRHHGLSNSEIAEVMGISVSTVEQHMTRALKALREAIASVVRRPR